MSAGRIRRIPSWLAATCAALAVVASPAARAQDLTGAGGGDATAGFGGGTSSAAAPAASAQMGGGGASAVRTQAAGFMAPEGVMGLKAPKGPRPVIKFNEAMGLTLANSFDLKIAAERMFQTELLVRKAWAIVLPRLNANITYNFAWPETQFGAITQEQLDAQADGQRRQLEGQALIYEGQAAANRADGDYNTAYANQAIANNLRSQASAIESGTAPDPVTINPAHTLNGGLSFSMVLFNGRSVPLLLNAYDAVKQTRATLSRARTQALYLTALGYFNTVAARRLEGIARQQLDNLSRHYEVTKVRVQVGSLPMLALRRIEADLARARANLRTVQNAYESAIGSLAMTLGVDSVFDVGDLPPIPLLEENVDPEELIARALSNRPDVAAARIAVQIAERNRMDALARWLPTVSLNANARASSNVRGFQRDPITYSVMLNAGIPLYDGGERYNAWRESGSQAREARLVLAQALQRVELSVRGNVREVVLRKENLENQRQSLSLAEAAARDSRARFEVGAATQLEVLDAEQLVTAAALDLSQAQLELQMARLALSFVVGAFDPAIGDGVPNDVSPVDPSRLPSPGSAGMVYLEEKSAPVVPTLAPAGRAARVSPGASVPLNPSAFDVVRSGLFDSRLTGVLP